MKKIQILTTVLIATGFALDQSKVHFEAGYFQSFALRSDSTMWFWGKDSLGPATGSVINALPSKVNSQKWAQISSGLYFGAALKPNGELWVWGSNNVHQLGMSGSSQNQAIRLGTDLWQSVSCGSKHQVAIRNDGTLWHWGDVYGTGSFIAFPTQISTSQWKQVSAGVGFSLAIDANDHLWSWGDNQSGELGLGNQVQKTTPVQVDTNRWIQAAAADGFSLAIRKDSTLWSWGDSTAGHLGHLSPTPFKPSQVNNDKWISVSAKSHFVLGLRSDSTLWVWGENSKGELGLGSQLNTSRPQMLAGRWLSASAGYDHSLAQKADGSLWAWGGNQLSELGDGSTSAALQPLGIGFESQTLVFDSVRPMIYGESLALNSSAFLTTVSYESSEPSMCELTQDSLKAKSVGTCILTAMARGDARYRPVFSSRTVSLLPKDLWIHAIAQSKTYGSLDPTLAWTAQGWAWNDTNTNLSGQPIRVLGENVGSYAIQQGSLASSKYNLHFQSDSLRILAKSLTITPKALSKAYGSSEPLLLWHAQGFIPQDDSTLVTGVLSRVSGEDVGKYAFQLGTLEAPNYQIQLNAVDSFSITPVSLNIQADPITQVYGDDAAELSFSATGFVNLEDASVLSGSLSRVPGDTVGTYAIELGSLNSNNYKIIFKSNILNLVPRSAVVKILPQQKYVGEQDPVVLFDVNNLKSGDQKSDLGIVFQRKLGDTVGFYPISIKNYSNHNYVLSVEADSLEISKQQQSLSYNWPKSVALGQILELPVTSSEGLALLYSTKDASICTIQNGSLSILKSGICELEIRQNGTTNFAPLFTQVLLSVDVNSAIWKSENLDLWGEQIQLLNVRGNVLWSGSKQEFKVAAAGFPKGLFVLSDFRHSQSYWNFGL